MRNHWKKNKQEYIASLPYEEQLAKAKEKAMRVMVVSMKSKEQITVLLKGEGYAEEVTQEVVAFLEGYQFLNDKALAESLMRSGMENKRYSKRKAMEKLRQRGLTKDDILDSMTEVEEDQEFQNALYLGRKKFDSLSNKPLRERLDKTGRSLSYKGFPYDLIRKTLEVLKQEEKEEDWS